MQFNLTKNLSVMLTVLGLAMAATMLFVNAYFTGEPPPVLRLFSFQSGIVHLWVPFSLMLCAGALIGAGVFSPSAKGTSGAVVGILVPLVVVLIIVIILMRVGVGGWGPE
jgi:hypothetical protein